MARKLKVFRTPIGFHDAYVAAPSQKAALQAWGTDTDLFARGVAEQVTDAALMEEPLAHPGDVIRKTRGSVDDHMAALPANPKRKPPNATDAPPAKIRRTKPKPRPSRSKLDQAEQAIEEAEQRYDAARRDLAAREAALRKERQALDNDRDRERERLETARADRERRYREAMAAWREGEAD
ncbi:hypothetical protein [uncultured Sphingomonas sp.]|uniref:hypothetical protein n=2 Tax=Sphingomonas TaxID=13687 RepID=UPI0026011AB6|nr:hypothetical protein [uncultured Sphingomonas sp.]